jgi:hypothetical protein
MPKPKAIPIGDDKVHVTLQFSEKDWEKVKSLMAHFSHSIPDQKIESLLLYWQAQVEKKKQKQIEKIQNEKSVDPHPPSVALDQKKTSMNQNELGPKSADKFAQKMKSSDILPPLRRSADCGGGLARRQAGVESKRQIRLSIPTAVQVQVRQKANDRCEYVSKATGRRCASTHFLENEHRIPVAKGGSNAIQNLRLFCRSHNALAAKRLGVSKTW